MPTRATKRGEDRTPLAGDRDVIVCGASFAGLAVARELAGAGARVLVLDRYEIGERQTSACAAPTELLEHMGLAGAVQQTFGSLLVHTPHGTTRWALPFTFSTFDYRTLCRLLWDQCDAEFETATIEGRDGRTIRTDRGELTAPILVDALGWRRILGAGANVQPPDARLSRGLEVHPNGSGTDLELWLDRRYVVAGYSWSFPAGDELRVGVGSFEPRDHVKDPTLRLAADRGVAAVRFQGNWIPHQLRTAVQDDVVFVGDSAGHCLPLTAEGIRTALYFGVAAGRELRAVVEGRSSLPAALDRYSRFHDAHRWKFDSMLRVQSAYRHVPPRLMALVVRAFGFRPLSRWVFGHYLTIAPPGAALPAPPARAAASARDVTGARAA